MHVCVITTYSLEDFSSYKACILAVQCVCVPLSVCVTQTHTHTVKSIDLPEFDTQYGFVSKQVRHLDHSFLLLMGLMPNIASLCRVSVTTKTLHAYSL